MAEDVKKFVVEVDAETYSVIAEYCEQANTEDHQVVNFLMNQSLDDFVKGYNNLKQGYVEMGKLNLEISNAFTVSENEAFSYVE